MPRDLVDGFLAAYTQALHDAEIEGRRYYHSLGPADDDSAVERLLPRMVADASGVLELDPACGRKRYVQVSLPADVRARARGWLEERDADKRPCGLSGILCGAEHPVPCSGVYKSLRKRPG